MLNLDKKEHYLLACSHGPDSMALLYMLKNEGYNFSVAHVNYHLRAESDEEERELRRYCRKNNIPIYVKDVDEWLGENNLEEKCRVIRYNFFKDLVDKYQFYAVLVAHNEDDVIETYLMQKRRQGLVEYYGIKMNPIIFDVKIIRPLLNYTKQDLLMYCNLNSVEFSIDKTNMENVFLRNKIRHQIVEKMSKEERVQILKDIEEDNRKLALILKKVSNINSNKVEDYNRLTDDEFLYALVNAGRKIKKEFTISRNQGLEIRAIFTSNKPNITLDVSGLVLTKSYDTFSLSEKEDDYDYSYVLNGPSLLDTPYFYLDFTEDASNRNVKESDYPLTIRTAKGDDIYPIKDYEKQLRRLFIDWKMPIHYRKRWPVIVNKDGKVIYVPRYQKDFVPDENCNFYVK